MKVEVEESAGLEPDTSPEISTWIEQVATSLGDAATLRSLSTYLIIVQN